MNEFVALIIAWFAVAAGLHVLQRLGYRTPLKVYYGVFIMLRDEELVKDILRPLSNLLKLPNWALAAVPIAFFLISMIYVVPLPLSIVGIDTVGIQSMLYLITRNLGIAAYALIHNLGGIDAVRSGFIPLAPLVPGVTVPLLTFLYIVIAVGLGILLHELAHGVLAVKYGARIKSGGAFAVLFLAFGGFVEIEEEDLRRMKLAQRLAVYSGGVFMNIVLAYLATLLVVIMINTPLHPLLGGVVVTHVVNSTHFMQGDVVLSVNGANIASVYDLYMRLKSVGYASLTMYNPTIGTYVVSVNTTNVVAEPLGSSSMYLQSLGIVVSNRPFYDLMFWIFNMNFTLVLLNTLPAYPLDGGQFMDSLLSVLVKNEKLRRRIMIMLSLALWAAVGITIYYTVSSGLYRFI